jgi:ribosomal protein S18 acetylase RimI-like enzyme
VSAKVARAERPTVRMARPGDRVSLTRLWTEVAELHARLLPGFFRRSDELAGEVARAVEETGANRTVLVAELGGALAGFAHVALYDTPRSPSLSPCRRAQVEAIAVAAGMRRRGIGRLLMEEASTWGRARGAAQLLLTVWAGNEEAEAFYRALGYRSLNQVLGRDL